MAMRRAPSRMLNDQRAVFGLWMSDFAAAIIIFVFLSVALEGTHYSLLALPISFGALIALSPIRLTQRRKIVRDWLWFHTTSDVLYDPKK